MTTDGVYLKAWLEPFEPFLSRPDVTEILINRPGQVWIEAAGEAHMVCHEAPEIDDLLLSRLASQIARLTHQAIGRETPLLSASLPSGERVQIIAPPASNHWAVAIRRHNRLDLTLSDYDKGPINPIRKVLTERQRSEAKKDPITFLKKAVTAHQTLLISGGTSSGKTTFLNALLKVVPNEERLILVEDTPEISASQPIPLRLLAVKGETGEARVTIDDVLQASLRLRPDRLIVGEIRGREAVTFLRAINTGHPGSFTTVHANTPLGALEQIALMVLQSGTQLSRQETLAYAASLIDVVVQLDRVNGERRITDIAFPRQLLGLD